jgi:protein-S-isoprenylcysteine O-methyltransferase Ste14
VIATPWHAVAPRFRDLGTISPVGAGDQLREERPGRHDDADVGLRATTRGRRPASPRGNVRGGGSRLWRVTLVLSQPAAQVLFGVTIVVWVIGERVLTVRDLRSGAWRSRQDAGSNIVVTVAVLAGFIACIVLATHQVVSLPNPTLWLVVGLVIAWTGMLLRLWAVLTLGRLFTTSVVVRPEQPVIASGPYRYVRHPAYLGVLTLFLGLGLALGDLASVAALVVLPAMAFVWRIRVEEAALRAELGSTYVEYAKGRARLIPGVW